ncbi:Ig-like domain-containing protein [Acidovorax sp. DW039]|uniref:Ig-like domain-containing protein n=1 Tax=Acidovorax sp. DW039 TaxID=3095606 RepID=UPI00308CFA58|nr:Ig-like domain-containing protein [Acidovorax sp. DW039]
MKNMIRYIFLILAAVLAACGGGGGSAGSSPSGGTPTPIVQLELSDTDGKVVSSITAGKAYQVKATVRDSSNNLVANRKVTFEVSNTTIAVLQQNSALTDAAGVAIVQISAASFTASGAATLKATVELPSTSGGSVSVGTVSKDFAVAAAGLSLSPLVIANPNLQAGGNTVVSVSALVAGSPLVGTPVNVAFTVSCGRINGLDASGGGVSTQTDGAGKASVTYVSVNSDGSLCSGSVSITATSPGAAARTASVSIAPPVANAIVFVSATPNQIFVAGSGSAEQAVATFKVLAASGTPISGIPVSFSISENPGGVGLNASGSTSSVTATTDQAGLVSVSIFSGTIPGPVKVKASLVAAPTVFSETQNLTIASGPASQKFMSLSVSTFNIEGWGVDGVSTTLTARIADRQGNAVADGTVINFTAEGGQVANSCATTTTNKISSCSVEFRTQNPRTSGGRVSVMAYLAGTKDYDDLNGNNIFDSTDNLRQLGDAFRDDNENGLFDSGEFVVSRGGTLSCPGVGGAFASRENTCNIGLSTTVRQTAVILFSSSSPFVADQVASAGGINFALGSADNNLLPMPAGTIISATPLADGCTVADIAGSPVVNTPATPGNPGEDLKTRVSIGLKGCARGGVVNVKITSPGGLTTVIPFTLN